MDRQGKTAEADRTLDLGSHGLQRMPRALLANAALHANAQIKNLRFRVILDERTNVHRKTMSPGNSIHVLEKLALVDIAGCHGRPRHLAYFLADDPLRFAERNLLAGARGRHQLGVDPLFYSIFLGRIASRREGFQELNEREVLQKPDVVWASQMFHHLIGNIA